MYPETPNQDDLIPGSIIANVVDQFIAPTRDSVIAHHRELVDAGLSPEVAHHLAVHVQSFLLDYVHHVLLDPEPQEATEDPDVHVVEVGGEDAEAILAALNGQRQARDVGPTDEAIHQALKDAVARKFRRDQEGTQ